MNNPKGRFDVHGGQYIPEMLMSALVELEEAYEHYKGDRQFNQELSELLNEYAGRPSRLYFAKKMTQDLGGAKIYLKREDMNHTGAHKINNVLGQALLAKKMGKVRLDRRNRRCTARRGHRYGCSVNGHEMRDSYGLRGYPSPGS